MKGIHVPIYEASLVTRHFSFTGYGDTREDARRALQAGLAAHAVQYGLPNNWWWDDDNGLQSLAQAVDELLEVRRFDFGEAYRDNEKIT